MKKVLMALVLSVATTSFAELRTVSPKLNGTLVELPNDRVHIIDPNIQIDNQTYYFTYEHDNGPVICKLLNKRFVEIGYGFNTNESFKMISFSEAGAMSFTQSHHGIRTVTCK